MSTPTSTRGPNCPLCHSSRHAKPFAERHIDESKLSRFSFASRKLPEYMHHQLQLCHSCDLLYAIPDPNLNLQSAYETAAYDSTTEAACAATTYRKILQPTLNSLPHKSRLLDIGAGDGAFLKEMLPHGFSDLIGLEPSSAPLHAAHPSIRNRLRMEMFREGLVEPQSCSLVTCFQTIEHVADPLALCREAAKLLIPGGSLAIIAHNRNGLINQLLGRKSPIFDIEHLQLFSPTSLKTLLEKAGLQNISIRPFRNTYPLAYWARLCPLPAPLKPTILRLLHATIGSLQLAVPVGNLLCTATKPTAPVHAGQRLGVNGQNTPRNDSAVLQQCNV